MAYYDAAQDYTNQQRQQNQSNLLSPYMASSSAGNPSSSYQSSGGAQAGSWGTPAPTYSQQKQQEGAQVQGYRAPQQASSGPTNWQAQANYYNQPQQQSPQNWNYPQQQPQGYQNPSNPPQGGYPPPQQGGGFLPPNIAQGGYQPQQAPNIAQGDRPQQVPGGMSAPPPNGDTNGFQMPRAVASPASRYALPGWDNGKWNDPNHLSPKYVVGRILSNLPGRTDQMGAAVQRIAAAYPGTQQVGQGDISIPGVGVIDILMGSAGGGKGWWWGDAAQVAAGQKKPAPAATQGGASTMDPYTLLMQTLMSPQPPPAYQPQAAPTPAPQAAFDITTNPQYQALQKQLADLTAQSKAQQAAQAQLQQQAQTWQTEAARGRGTVNNPSFAYY